MKCQICTTVCLLLVVTMSANAQQGTNVEDSKRQLIDGTNEMIQLFADDEKVWYLNINETFLDDAGTLPTKIMPDLLHPNARGYELWATAMEPTLKALLEK